MTTPTKNHSVRAGLSSRHFLQHHSVQGDVRHNLKRPLGVMKFGGTSVSDASCIEKVIEIIRTASLDRDIVVVVSAMSGVTNKLIEAATRSELGERTPVGAILEGLRRRHETAVSALIHSPAEQNRVNLKIQELLEEGDRLCASTLFLRELTLRTRDSISSLGERLSAPLVAAALAERGVLSEAIEATELVVTDSCHDAADPCMDLTQERCETRLRPLLERGVIPVVTGFIGATREGVLTTLGRGGSDCSATILGTALNADEVIIWTDVDGLQTADPRLVPGGSTIPEISYREAAELAYFGAKVLHPKTLRAVMQSCVPLWVRNTFAPELPGTKITPTGPLCAGGVKALTATSDVVLITIGGLGMAGVPDVMRRTLRTTVGVRADVLLISQSSSQSDLCLVISSAFAKRTVEALRHEFSHDPAHEQVEHISVDSTVAIVTVVGQNIRGIAGVVGRSCSALDRENVDIVTIAHGSTECTMSFVVAKRDMKAALITLHREFQLGPLSNSIRAEPETHYRYCESLQISQSADQENN
jgi:bifunctional aspartokinase / homoserine dehydrogenase 1